MLHRCSPFPALLQGADRRTANSSPRGDNTRQPQPATAAGPRDIDALIESLQRPGAPAMAPGLHLSARTDAEAEALAEPLLKLDELARQGALTALTVTVEEPVGDRLRELLADSKGLLVLSGATLRPLLFRDLARVRNELQKPDSEALDDFLGMRLGAKPGQALPVQVASTLARIAVASGEDALLRAVSVLSPCYQWRFTGVPEPQLYARLARLGVPCSLGLRITRDSACALADWLQVPRPLLQAVEFDLAESLDADAAMPLWTGVANQGSIRRVELTIPSGVEIGWTARTEPAWVHTARLPLLRIRLHDLYKQTSPLVAQFMEWFQPVDLELRSLWVSSAATTLDGLDPAHQRPLHSLSVVCEHAIGPLEPSLTHALIGFLLRFDRVGQVRVSVRHALPGDMVLKTLNTVAGQNLQLRSVELVRNVASTWEGHRHRFEKTLEQGLRKGTRFFRAYLVGDIEGFFQHHVVGTADPAQTVIDGEWLSTRDALALDLVSSHTHRAAVARRRQEQALVLVTAMGDGSLEPATLRELLTGPSGEIDTGLVTAVFLRLCDAREDEAVWRLFDEATAFCE